MRSQRLTGQLSATIERNAMTHLFNEQFAKANHRLLDCFAGVFKWMFRQDLPKWCKLPPQWQGAHSYPQICNLTMIVNYQPPEEFLPKHAPESRMVSVQVNDLMSFLPKGFAAMPHFKGLLNTNINNSYSYPLGKNQEPVPNLLTKQLIDAWDEVERIRTEAHTVRKQIKSLLDGVNTTKQAAVLWPEVVSFIPKDESEPSPRKRKAGFVPTAYELELGNQLSDIMEHAKPLPSTSGEQAND